LVGAGIFASRLIGLVRERAFAHYFGNSVAAAAFKAALRIPNFLQNLLGEGVLSASFIPVYAGLIGKGDKEEADRVASAVFGLLTLLVSLLVAAGMFGTPVLIDLIAPGFEGETRELAIRLVRILFPGTGVLVLSAWCLGVLNSHRKFLLSYMAPVIWNLAIIGVLLFYGPQNKNDLFELAEKTAWGVVAGGVLQFLVQLPSVLRLVRKFRPTISTALASTRQVLRSFGPVVVGRGVVQVSGYVDTAVATLISARALAALTYAQTIYLLPVSLFGMAVSAAELPEMSQVEGTKEEIATKLRARIDQGLQRIAFFVLPSAVALFLLGDVAGGALFQTGRFGVSDTRFLWYLLASASIGLLATTFGRLYASAFYALKDTKTPLYAATARVALGGVLAYLAALRAPEYLGLVSEMGACGIVVASSFAAWLELLILRALLSRRIGKTGLGASRFLVLSASALLAGAFGVGVKAGLTAQLGPAAADSAFFPMPALHPVLTAIAVFSVFGAVYFGATTALGVPQARALTGRLTSRLRR
jgi:putative peptidoglycan lipid II flippase